MTTTAPEKLADTLTGDALLNPPDAKRARIGITVDKTPTSTLRTQESPMLTSQSVPTIEPTPDTRTALHGPSGGLPPDTGFLRVITNVMSRIRPIRENKLITLNSSDYSSVFKEMYDSYMDLLYPENSDAYITLTQDQFVLVSRYFLKMRIDHVYAQATGRRQATGRIPLNRSITLPKALADLINSIGTVMVHSGSIYVIPEPEATPQDATTQLTNQVICVRSLSI